MSKTAMVHSVESFGAADGPGIRYVIFLQGCPMRCKYCHNPDTWEIDAGVEMTADKLLQMALKYKSYWKDNGGITVSGGEPLLHINFLIEFFKLAKENGVNTALDTSGCLFSNSEFFMEKFDELMKYTDLVILDIKQINSERHKILTGRYNNNIIDMAMYLSKINKPVWIRHVLVPEYSDFDEDLQELSKFLHTLNNVEKVEILPYHTLGSFKWKALGIPYELSDIQPPTNERIENAKKILGI